MLLNVYRAAHLTDAYRNTMRCDWMRYHAITYPQHGLSTIQKSPSTCVFAVFLVMPDFIYLTEDIFY